MTDSSTRDTRAFAKIVGGLVLFFALLLPESIPSPVSEPLTGVAQRTLAASALVAFWWLTSPIPLAATSLLPIALFPLLGVMSAKDVSKAYINDSVHLYMAGFMVALGIERWNLHRRIAVWVLLFVGSSARRIMLGMMIATAFLSMWISNTATTLLMLPIASALVSSFERRLGDHLDPNAPQRAAVSRFATALLLSIAYSSSVGGIGTLIGTPTNALFVGMSAKLYPAAPPISFSSWMVCFAPFSAIMVLIIWWLMAPSSKSEIGGDAESGDAIIQNELRELGPMSVAEWRMLVIFACTALLWMSRGSIDLGETRIPGWTNGLEVIAHRIGWMEFKAAMVSDTTVAIAMAGLMFFIPSGTGPGKPLMTWEAATKLPWGILILIGGGFAIAEAFESTGVSRWMGSQFLFVAGWHPIAIVLGICFVMTFLTEITSNVATTAVMLPVLAGSAVSLEVHPWLLMIPATVTASCAFMLPVATPPNAIVFSTGKIQITDMARHGLLINLIGVVVVTALVYFVAVPILGFDPTVVPDWAR